MQLASGPHWCQSLWPAASSHPARRYGSSNTTGTGAGVTIYVVDSGIKLDHQEFKNDLGTQVRASYGELEPAGRSV